MYQNLPQGPINKSSLSRVSSPWPNVRARRNRKARSKEVLTRQLAGTLRRRNRRRPRPNRNRRLPRPNRRPNRRLPRPRPSLRPSVRRPAKNRHSSSKVRHETRDYRFSYDRMFCLEHFSSSLDLCQITKVNPELRLCDMIGRTSAET